MVRIVFERKNNRSVAYDDNTQIGECTFIETGDVWNINHTEVDSLYRGQGIAKKLVATVIENSKVYSKNIIADCSYAKKLI